MIFDVKLYITTIEIYMPTGNINKQTNKQTQHNTTIILIEILLLIYF